jgi:hypothetical protein
MWSRSLRKSLSSALSAASRASRVVRAAASRILSMATAFCLDSTSMRGLLPLSAATETARARCDVLGARLRATGLRPSMPSDVSGLTANGHAVPPSFLAKSGNGLLFVRRRGASAGGTTPARRLSRCLGACSKGLINGAADRSGSDSGGSASAAGYGSRLPSSQPSSSVCSLRSDGRSQAPRLPSVRGRSLAAARAMRARRRSRP